MSNFFKTFFEKYTFLKTFFIIGLVQIIFLSLTYNNYFFSDDYQTLIGLKLYNLIQGEYLSLQNLFELNSNHFIPFYFFYNQFMPDNYIYYHGIVALIFFFSSLLVFQIAFKLTNSNKISFLSSFLYSINMSIHIKPYVWNVFHFSIINSFTGLLGILFFIKYYQTNNLKKYLWLFLYITFSTLSCLNFENGLLYPIIATAIVFLFFSKKSLKKNLIGLIPIGIFLILLIITGKDPLYLAKERLNKTYNERLTNKIEINPKTYSYFYRSQYAKRDLTGYTFRVFDNISSTLNLYSLESSLKYFSDSNTLKNYILNNYLQLILALFIIFFILIIIFIKNLKQITFQYPILKFLVLYLLTFFIYTFIFFRQDINSALAFTSSILISILIIEFYKNSLSFLPSLFLFFFIGSTVLYSSTGFEVIKYRENKSFVKKLSNIHYENAINKKNDKSIQNYQDYIFLYYYLNYQDKKNYLKKYKNLKYSNFISAMMNE